MKLLENYSLQLGQKIDKCHTYEKYYPLPFENKIVVIQPWSKGSKNYSFYSDVLDILYPILGKSGYKLVQVGGTNEQPLKYCYHTQGSTNWGQLEYLISKASLVISADSISAHLAGHYNIPLCVLISNNFKECVAPYFGDKTKQIILEPDRANKNPLFMLDEPGRKQIDEILPETIAQSCCTLLNIPFNWPYKTIYTGEISLATMSISCCDSIINNQQLGIPSIIMDLTLNFDENILLNQMNVCEVSVITAKPLSDNIFNHHKQSKRIKELIYEITEDNNPDFAQKVIRNGISLRLVSKLPEDKINELKLKYYEIGIIWPLKQFNPNNIPELKDKDLSNLYFKSARFLFSKGKVYSSKAHLLKDMAINSFDDILPIIDVPEFWENLDSFKILVKK